MNAPRSFEDAMTRLEEIVHELEAGDVALEETLNLFKEGIEMRARCAELLRSAEKELKVLMESIDGTTEEVDLPAAGLSSTAFTARDAEDSREGDTLTIDPDDLPFE